MNKLYACMQQGRTLLATILMLLIAPLSMLTFGQSPCTSPVIREATNAKSTNGNLYDDITIAMTNLLGNGTEAAWVMESGATFTENPDGTAHLQGIVKQFGDYVTPRRLAMDVTLADRSFTPDASGPYNQTGVPTDGWYYYHTLSGTFTGLDAIAGGKLSLNIHMHPFQVGIGANQMFVAEDQVANGAGGWFEWTVVTQPTDPALQFTNYIPGITISDFAMLLSGTPSTPCVLNGSIGDQVYCDVNNNGIFDAGDVTVTGLTVTLCDANSVQIATQTVDSNGKYLFTDLPAGNYIVKFPATTLDGKPQRNLGNISVNLTAGQNYLDADKGYYKAPVDPCQNDTEAPVFVNCPSDITLTADCRTNQATATWTTPTANDNCTTVRISSSHQSGASFNVGTTIVTFTATDAAGNTKICTFNVIVNAAIDTEKPVFSNCPTSILKDVVNSTSTCWTINWTKPTATDNCSTPVVTSNYNSGDCFPAGLTVVTYTATDASGNTATCSFGVNITKTTSCSVTGNTITKSCVNNIPALTGSILAGHEYIWLISTVSCPTQLSQAISGATGQNYNLPSRVVATTYFVRLARPIGCTTWNTINASNCITVNANECAPVSCTVTGNTLTKSCVNNIPVITGTNLGNYEYVWLMSTAGCPTQASQAIAGATAQNYTLPSRVTVTTYFVRCARPVGCTTWGTVNESNCITVYPTDCAPVSCTVTGNTLTKSCVNNIPVITGTNLGNYEYVWLKSTTGCPTQASQAVAGATAQNYTLPSRVTVTTYFVRCARPIGCTTWGTVNESNCITVLPSDCDPCLSDVTPPSISCPAAINKDVTGMTGTCWTITYAMPTATDNCSTATVVRESGPTSGSCLAVGSYDVVFKATDAKGNIARCTLKINITQTDPCAGISSIRSVKNTYDYCGNSTRQPYVALFNGQYYTAGSDLKFTEYTNGTALLKGTIYTGGVAYWINMTFSGKTTVSSGSPKIMLCATGNTTGSGWYYYTTTGGQINTPSGTYSLTRQGPAFQIGQFANLQENTYGASGWFYGNGTVSGDVNMNLGPVEACGTTTSCTGVGATVYTDCSYGGTARSLSVGTYTLAQLNALGIPNDVISSIKVNAGFKITLYCDDYFVGQPLVKTADDICFVDDNFNDVVSSIKVECNTPTTVSCTVTGNTISKSCVNNLPVVTGTNLGNYEYVWLKSTTGCPTQSSQAIAGATGQNYSLPSACTVTTYFVRCARPIGCTTWGTVNESNCVTVYPTDCPAVATCSINFSSTKSYRIVNKRSGKALDVYGGGLNNDCPIVQWNYNGTANQQWRLFSLGSGYFKVMARNSGKYLACHYTSDAAPVYQYDYYSGGYKDWKIECVGNTGYYRLVHSASGKVLDVPGSSTADGAKMQIYSWNGTDAQLFKIEEVVAAPAAYSASSTVLAMNATAESDRVRLSWLSNTGYDNDFYTVEKMNASTGDFEKMSLVNNTQFDDQVQTHVVNDVQPTEGDNFYRVKVTLNDGQEKLTDVKKVTFKRMVGFGAFPNPASDELNVNLSEYTGKAVDIVIYNTFGKAVLREHVKNVANATHSLNISEFAAGQYHIRVSSEGKRDATQPVVIQK